MGVEAVPLFEERVDSRLLFLDLRSKRLRRVVHLGRTGQGVDAVFDLKYAFHRAESDTVAVIEFRLDDAMAVDEGLVGRVEILEPVFAANQDELGMVSRDRRVLDANGIVGFPTDGSQRTFAPVNGFPLAGNIEDEATARGGFQFHFGTRGLYPKDGFDIAEPDRVSVMERGFGYGDAIEPAFVGRAKVPQFIRLSFADDLGVIP